MPSEMFLVVADTRMLLGTRFTEAVVWCLSTFQYDGAQMSVTTFFRFHLDIKRCEPVVVVFFF